MPGPALHHLIADTLRSRINSNTGLGGTPDYARLQALLADPKNLPYLFLGCQGPDFLFFNTKDWPAGIGDAVEIYYKVYDAIDDFKKALLSLVPQPVLDALEAVGEAVDTVVESSSTLSELEQLFNDMSSVVDGLAANLTEMIKKFISDFKVYDALSHPYRDGQPKGEWWWFDALHYRKTGRYAKALLDNTGPDSPLRLYALGYLTHFTTDTVGHPYVNINSGGPYRNQAQRHKTGENSQDVFNMKNHTGEDWNRSRLHALYNFNYEGILSPVEEDEDFIPDPNTHLPPDLAELIANTINSLYEAGTADDNEYGRHLSAEDVNNSYRLWYRWMRSATDTGTLPKPVPYDLIKELEEVWDKAMDNLDDIGDFIRDALNSAGSFSILSIFIALAAIVVAAVAAAAALIDAVLGALTTLSVAGIRYAASLIYEQLYNAFTNFRLGVALNGLAFPMQEHLNEIRFRQFKNTSFPDSTGSNAASLQHEMPRMKFGLPSDGSLASELFNREAHLAYPASSGEPAHAIGAPDSYFDATSLFYAFGDIPLNKAFIDELAALNGSDGDGTLAGIIRRLTDDKGAPTLGNAIMLTEEIFERWRTGGKIPDFNLDADRGYAYTCWTQQTGGVRNDPERPQHLSQSPGVDLQFIKNA